MRLKALVELRAPRGPNDGTQAAHREAAEHAALVLLVAAEDDDEHQVAHVARGQREQVEREKADAKRVVGQRLLGQQLPEHDHRADRAEHQVAEQQREALHEHRALGVRRAHASQ